MRGIVGYIGYREAYPILIKGLKRLEYRGYDSAGVALISDNGEMNVYKEKGKVVNVVETKATLPKFTVGTMGLYDGGFNNESLKDAKVYEIEAVVNDGYSETTHKYKGFKK